MKDKIKPTLVLTVICVIASLLLTYAHELTKTRIADQKEQKFSESVEALFGKTDSRLINDSDMMRSRLLQLLLTARQLYRSVPTVTRKMA